MPPKTASNSIKEMLRMSGVDLTTPKKQTIPHIHLKISEIKDQYNLESLDKYNVIQVVRNPYERMVSSYFHYLRLIPNSEYGKLTFQKFLELILECSKSSNFLNCFYNDLEFINNSIKSKIHWGGSRLFDSQSSWNDLDFNLTYFKIEDLSSSMSSISEFMGINLCSLPKININNSVTDYSQILSPVNKLLIEKIFFSDFEKFSY
jgi:hypothetical protein